MTQEGPDLPAVQIEASALMCDALRRVRGVELYDEQLLAALILAKDTWPRCRRAKARHSPVPRPPTCTD